MVRHGGPLPGTSWRKESEEKPASAAALSVSCARGRSRAGSRRGTSRLRRGEGVDVSRAGEGQNAATTAESARGWVSSPSRIKPPSTIQSPVRKRAGRVPVCRAQHCPCPPCVSMRARSAACGDALAVHYKHSPSANDPGGRAGCVSAGEWLLTSYDFLLSPSRPRPLFLQSEDAKGVF